MPRMSLARFIKLIEQFPPGHSAEEWIGTYGQAILNDEPPATLPPGIVWPEEEGE